MKDSNNLFIDSLGKSFSQNDSETFKDYASYKNMIGEAEKPKKIKYIKPNFKVEFSELKRYRDLEDMSMNDWLTVAENGEVVNFEEIKDDLKNVKLDLDKISDEKKERFNKHYDSGTIRLPIAILLNGDYYLLGGNTRIAGLLSKGKKPKVWLIKFNNKDEQKEATSTASSGQYSGPLFSKIEATEATTSGSVGGYQTPAMWAKSTKKSDFRGAAKTQIPGGEFVTVKKKCKTFPYCNQGDINALKIHEASETLLEDRVNSIIRKALYLKKINREVGFLGPITTKQLFNGTLLKDEGNDILEYFDEEYDDDNDNFDVIFSNNILYKIWDRYAKAMARRRPDSVKSLYNFVNYIISSNYPVYIFKYNRSYIIGQLSGGFFRVSHFAPYSIKEGLDGIREIIKFNNIIFAVTDDLKSMLTKMGAYDSGTVLPMLFKGEYVDKHIISTDENAIKKIVDYLSNPEKHGETPKGKKYVEYPEADIFLKRMGKKDK